MSESLRQQETAHANAGISKNIAIVLLVSRPAHLTPAPTLLRMPVAGMAGEDKEAEPSRAEIRVAEVSRLEVEVEVEVEVDVDENS